MVVFHCCFDLNHFGILSGDFNHSEFWLNWRVVILSSFLFVSGLSHASAQSSWQSLGYWKRQLQVLAGALLISVVTYFMFPETWIRYGVLHFFFLSGLLAPAFVARPRISGLLGVGFILLPIFFRHFLFQRFSLIWIGLAPFKPPMEDFVPLFPWFGVVLLGISAFSIFKTSPWMKKKYKGPTATALQWVGRKSFWIYLTHQWLLFPLAWMIQKTYEM
jgi:uncharacterized membrane protein